MAVNRPAKIGKYDVIDVIGRGGMGIVYKGSDPYLDRLVAIKMMTGQFADNADLLKRFYREAQSTASLQHPNIVTVFELGDHSGNPYLVMEYLDGESLDSIISSRRQLGIVEKIELMIAICQGLSYAHARGIVHRDIKPANVMVCTGGGVKIVDFGIAHFGDKNVTRTGQIVGSISYMSPEQINGRQVDARTDIFSAGVVLYQLFTYALPFEGESTASTLLKIINEPPPPLKDFLAAYPPQLQTIVDRALAKDRNERYGSADELALDLGQLQSQLKQEMVSRYLDEASQLIESNDLYRAKSQVLQVLKIDRHNTKASYLLRELQGKIQRQEIDEEVRQLRSQAEEAFAQKQFETALGHVERAISLDKQNPDLQQLRAAVKEAEQLAQKFQRAVRLAESAHQMGDLDLALQTIEEALEIVPNDTHARSLHRTIQNDWADRTRQRQLENFVEQARRDIASRKFTSALELLQQALTLDPAAPQIRPLIEAATTAKEQERRRKELEAINREIEDALNRDDYSKATERADAGLKSFPLERGLLKLKALAEKQRQVAERKQFVDEQLALASSLLEQGRGEELVGRLEAALAKVGGEPRLQSLLLVVRENVERERLEKRRAEYLQKAREALRRKQHDEAVRILEAARNELQDAGEIDDLLQFAKEDAVNERRRQAADAAAEQARGLIERQEYDRAIQLLEQTLQEIPDDELGILLEEARHALLDNEKRMESILSSARKLIESRKPSEAVNLLNSQTDSFSRSPELQKLLALANAEAQRLSQVNEAVRQSRDLAAGEDYARAIAVLEECRQSHGSSPDLEQQMAHVSERLSAAASGALQKAMSDARMLLNAAQYRGVLDRLALAAQLLPSVPPALKADYENLKAQATNGLAHQRTLEIQRHVAAGEITGAAQLLQQTLTEFPGRQDLSELETLIDQETARKSDAQSKLSEAQNLLEKKLWKPAADLLKQGFAAAQHLPAVREAILTAFVEGAQAAAETDWRAAESLVARARELQANYRFPSALLAKIAERQREEGITACLEQATQLQSAGDFNSAQSELTRGLTTYAGDPRLAEFQEALRGQVQERERRAREERERIDKANFLRQVGQKAEQETRLEHRSQILQDALTRYPDDPTLELQLTEVHDLQSRVTQIADEARLQEDAKHYDEALQQWDKLRTVYPQYPDLDRNVARLRKLSEEELAAKKADQVRSLQSIIASGDFEQSGTMLHQLQQEFPSDGKLAELESDIREAVKLRTKAQKLLGTAEKAFEKSQWEKGVSSLGRACKAAPNDPLVRKQAIDHFAQAFDSALQSDWQSGNLLLLHADELRIDPAFLQSLRNRVEDRKKAQMVAGYLAQSTSAQKGGHLEESLRHLEIGLAVLPDEPQLKRAKTQIEDRLREQEREQQRQLDLKRQQAQAEEQRRLEESDRLRAAAEASRQEELRQAQQETQHDFDQTQNISAVRQVEIPAAPTASITQTFLGPTAPPEPPVEDVEPEKPSQPVRETIAPAPVKLPSRRPPQRETRPLPITAVAIGVALLAVVTGGILWMRSVPAKVAIGIATAPPGASIRISDTGDSCVTPNCTLNLRPGSYEVEAQLDGYQAARQPITVGTQGSYSIEIVMVPIAGKKSEQSTAATNKNEVPEKPGELVIRDAPAGAQVFVDGNLKGKATNRGTFSMNVPAGEHQVSVVARNEPANPITRQFPSDGRVELSQPDFKVAPPPATTGSAPRPEESDWLRIKDSRNAGDVSSFLARYPRGAHRSEAESKLEDLSWQSVENTNDAAALDDFRKRYPSGRYHDRAAAHADDLLWTRTARDSSGLRSYLQQLPAGRHADEARAGLASDAEAQDWARVRLSNQPSDINSFLSKYPRSSHAAEAESRVQELAWTQISRDDVQALQQYLNSYPASRHAEEASRRIDDLSWNKVDKKDRAALQAFASRHPGSAHRADAQAALDQLASREGQRKTLQQPLDLFNAAFEHQQPRELKDIWPGATEQYIQALRPPAGYKVSIRLQPSGEPSISGDTAKIPCDLISVTTGPGGQGKQNRKAVTVYLYKSGDRWLIRDPFGQ